MRMVARQQLHQIQTLPSIQQIRIIIKMDLWTLLQHITVYYGLNMMCRIIIKYIVEIYPSEGK